MEPTNTTPAQTWRSESIAKLSSALAKAQADFPTIEKTKTASIKSDKGSYSYKYADLADVISATRPSLSKNALAVLQIIRMEGNRQILQATLTHESGEWIQSELVLPTWSNPQALGSLLTYLRRYLYTAIIGVAADEDDDGNGAVADSKPKGAQASEKPQGRAQAGGGVKPPAEAPKPYNGDPGAYVVPFGNSKDSRLDQLSDADLAGLESFYADLDKKKQTPKGKAAELRPVLDAYLKARRGAPTQEPKQTFPQFLQSFGWSMQQAEEWMTLKFRLPHGQRPTPQQIEELTKIVKTSRPEEALFLVRDPQ